MEPNDKAPRDAASALLSLLALGTSRNGLVSALHERALRVSGGSCSPLFEHNPASAQLQVTSGAGLEVLSMEPWSPSGGEGTLLAQACAGRSSTAITGVVEHMPELHARLRTDHAVLLPLVRDSQLIALLAIGIESAPQPVVAALDGSEVPSGFAVALELSRLREREEFGLEIRDLLDTFADRLAATLDLDQALELLCVAAIRLFGADRAAVWLHERDSHVLSLAASSHATLPTRSAPVRVDDPLSPAAAMRTQRAGLAREKGSRRALSQCCCEAAVARSAAWCSRAYASNRATTSPC